MKLHDLCACGVSLALCMAAFGADESVRDVSGLVTDRGFEKGRWRLVGDTTYSTTNCQPRFGKSAFIDTAGRVLTLKMVDKSWDNTFFTDSVVTNGGATPGRIHMDTIWGKLHVESPHWHGGPQNVIDVSRGRFYVRTKVDVADCWSLRLADETVMGGAVTGADAGKFVWAGPVEFGGNVLFADDTNTPQGGWGCTFTGPMSGPETAVVALARAFCLRIGSKASTFAGQWSLRGGGDGTYRCRLELLKDAVFSGKSIRMENSDIAMDAATAYRLPRTKFLSGDGRIAGGAPGTTLASLLKQGRGTLTLASPLRVEGTVRIEDGVFVVAKDAAGRLPALRRLVFLPGAVFDMGGNDLTVEEMVGTPELRNAGKLTVLRTTPLSHPPATTARDVFARLQKLAHSKQFMWAWTEQWTTWGSLEHGEWPHFQTRIGELTDRAPLMSYYDLATLTGTRMPEDSNLAHARVVAETIRTHWRACRGIPVFSWHMDHPCTTNGFSQAWYRYKCKEHRNVIKDILDGTKYPCGRYMQWERTVRPGYDSPRAWYFARMDEVVAFFNRLIDDDGNKIPVILRYEHEMDGCWFWWGDTWCTPAEFVAFSRLTADYLRAKCGKDQILFAYTPDRTWKELGKEGDGGHNFLSWYAGDAYTDIIGFDDYSIGKGETDAKADENFNETLRKLRLVSAFADAHGKVMGITETGCKDARTDFWARLLKLATADGVNCAFVDTWGGPWTMPESVEGVLDQKRFYKNPAVLTIPDEQLQKAVDDGY